MTTNTTEVTAVSITFGWTTDEALANIINDKEAAIAVLENEVHYAVTALTLRLQNRGALALAHPTLEVSLVYPSPTYETSKLKALAELVPPEDYAKAYQPEWVKEVPQPARFDGRQLNSLARKYGQPVREILAAAQLPSTPRLVVKAKALAVPSTTTKEEQA